MKIQSIDWLAEFLYHALDAGTMIEVGNSQNTEYIFTVLEKVKKLVKRHKKQWLRWYWQGDGSFTTNPKAKNNWPLLSVTLDSDGNLFTLTVCDWVGIDNGQLLNMNTRILELTSLEAYREVNQLAQIDRFFPPSFKRS